MFDVFALIVWLFPAWFRFFLKCAACFLALWALVHVRYLIHWGKEPFPWKKACVRLVTICILPAMIVTAGEVCIGLDRTGHREITKYPFEDPMNF